MPLAVRNRLNPILFAAALCLSCCDAATAQEVRQPAEPTLRIGIVEGRQRIVFTVVGKPASTGRDHDGLPPRLTKGRWKVEVVDAVPAKTIYMLSVGIKKDRDAADRLVEALQRKGLGAYVKSIPNKRLTLQAGTRKTVYQVLLTVPFKAEKAAEAYRRAISTKSNTEVVRIPLGASTGKLLVTNLTTGDTFDGKRRVRIRGQRVRIAGVDVGAGYHWQTRQERSYTGEVEFVLDADGLITAVVSLPLEEYLRGVVPSEMPSDFPLEALKAQAVCARSEAVTKVGLRHLYQPFELCDDVHCQVYSGVTEHANKTDTAIRRTRGVFMMFDGEIAQAFYAGVCGGHTEDNDNVWNMDPEPYLRGLPDAPGGKLPQNPSLRSETGVKQWIDSRPDVYCNSISNRVPRAMSYSKKYFRWRLVYSRRRLEQIIAEKTGRDFGNLLELKPLQRGVSGRIRRLQITGTRETFVVEKELSIRQALSPTTLYSSCFYVQTLGRKNGLPTTFTFFGAGWGHGVGMCQIGAARRALTGRKYDEILRHYYQGIYLTKLYH